MKTAFIILGIIYLIISLTFILGPEIKQKYIYKSHKKRTAKCLYKLAKLHDNLLINNFVIKKDDEIIKFDHVYFGNKYIYCIKDVSKKFGLQGNIHDSKWLFYNSKSRDGFIDNPLIENTDQVLSLKKHLGVDENEQFFFSIICISDNCEIDIVGSSKIECVLKHKDIKKFILLKEKDKSVSPINQNLLENTVKVLYQQCQQNDSLK